MCRGTRWLQVLVNITGGEDAQGWTAAGGGAVWIPQSRFSIPVCGGKPAGKGRDKAVRRFPNAKLCLMFSFNPTINLGLGKNSADKPKDAVAPQPATPIQQGTGPIQLELLGDPVLLLMLTAIVILSSAVLVYAARH